MYILYFHFHLTEQRNLSSIFKKTHFLICLRWGTRSLALIFCSVSIAETEQSCVCYCCLYQKSSKDMRFRLSLWEQFKSYWPPKLYDSSRFLHQNSLILIFLEGGKAEICCPHNPLATVVDKIDFLKIEKHTLFLLGNKPEADEVWALQK